MIHQRFTPDEVISLNWTYSSIDHKIIRNSSNPNMVESVVVNVSFESYLQPFGILKINKTISFNRGNSHTINVQPPNYPIVNFYLDFNDYKGSIDDIAIINNNTRNEHNILLVIDIIKVNENELIFNYVNRLVNERFNEISRDFPGGIFGEIIIG